MWGFTVGARVSRGGGVLLSFGFSSSLSLCCVVCVCFVFLLFSVFLFAVVLSLRAIVLRASVLFFLSWFRLFCYLIFP